MSCVSITLWWCYFGLQTTGQPCRDACIIYSIWLQQNCSMEPWRKTVQNMYWSYMTTRQGSCHQMSVRWWHVVRTPQVRSNILLRLQSYFKSKYKTVIPLKKMITFFFSRFYEVRSRIISVGWSRKKCDLRWVKPWGLECSSDWISSHWCPDL